MKTVSRLMLRASIVGLTALLVACGGGGGGSGTASSVSSTNSFSFAAANANRINNGLTHNFTLTGTQVVGGVTYNVTGSGTVTESPASSSFFNNQVALLNTQTINGTITVNGTTVPLPSTTVQTYSTTNYSPLGMVYSGGYCVMQGTPTIPSTVKVGDTAVLGTYTCYSDSTTATVVGTTKLSYAIEPDTANTAVVNIIEEEYDNSNVLQSTDQARWRVDLVGTASFVSETATGSGFSYTFN